MATLGQGDARLASLDFLGPAGDPRAVARDRYAEPDRSGTHEGADGSDSVWVSVDVRGRVLSVDLSRNWRQRMTPGELGGALHASYADAVRKAVLAATAAARPGGGSDVAEPARSGDGSDWRAATWAALDAIDADLSRQRRVIAGEARQPRDETVRSPHGLFTVTLRGAAIVAITGDVTRILAADVERLRQEAMAALRYADR